MNPKQYDTSAPRAPSEHPEGLQTAHQALQEALEFSAQVRCLHRALTGEFPAELGYGHDQKTLDPSKPQPNGVLPKLEQACISVLNELAQGREALVAMRKLLEPN